MPVLIASPASPKDKESRWWTRQVLTYVNMKTTHNTPVGFKHPWIRTLGTLALFWWAAGAVGGAHAQLFSLEEPAYQSLEKEAAFELRLYAPMIVAEVVVQGDLATAGKEGARLVKQYIFRQGPNAELDSKTQATDRLSMTVPVTMEATTSSSYRLHFVMPAAYTLANLPKSADPRVSIRAVPEQKWASVRFSKFSTEANIAAQTALLQNWVDQKGWLAIGPPQFARYDPPSVPPMLRRSEILVPVQ